MTQTQTWSNTAARKCRHCNQHCWSGVHFIVRQANAPFWVPPLMEYDICQGCMMASAPGHLPMHLPPPPPGGGTQQYAIEFESFGETDLPKRLQP